MSVGTVAPHTLQQLRSLTFDHLFAVRTIASTGSFREASKILCLSQPAVSQRVQFIEHALGAPIFERHSGVGVTLTDVGVTFLDFCVRTIEQLDDYSRELASALEPTDSSTITITAPSDSIQHFIIRLLPHFRAAFPHRQIRVTQSGSRTETLTQISDGTADLAFYRMPVDPALAVVAIMSERLHLVAAPSHEICGLKPHERIDALGAFSFATFLPTMRSRQLIERWAFRTGAQFQVDIESQSPSVMRQSVLSGSALSILPGTAIAEDLEAGRLRIVEMEGMPLERATALAVKPGNESSPTIRALVDVLVKFSMRAQDEGTPDIRWATETRSPVLRASPGA